MNSKKVAIQQRIAAWAGRSRDARYLAYFDCFNRQQYYEAHDVLEDLWLERRGTPEANFYKALIQLAGAFVHLEKGRRGPAAALLRLAAGYLRSYPVGMGGLQLPAVLRLIEQWLAVAEQPSGRRILVSQPPQLPWPAGSRED